MQKGSGTRSGLLWEVERILDECNGNLPQVLLMENVPQVISKNNIKDFQLWRSKLETLGYSNFVQLLNAKDYGIPQNRNRCFMVSILGNWHYEFPKKIPLKLRLKDMLEENVDEKYYLSQKGIDYICGNAINKNLKDKIDREKTYINKDVAYTLNLNPFRRCGDSNYILDGYEQTSVKQFLKIRNATKKGYLYAKEGDGIDIGSRMDSHRGTVQKDMAQTIKTSIDVGVCVVGNYMPSGNEASRIVDPDGLAPTVKENHGTVNAVVDSKESMEVMSYEEPHGWNKGIFNNDCQSLRSSHIQKIAMMDNCATAENNLRIRKLTSKECWRLMGFDDEDYEKAKQVNSESQLYKQAGNSIVVNVLMAIFKEIL